MRCHWKLLAVSAACALVLTGCSLPKLDGILPWLDDKPPVAAGPAVESQTVPLTPGTETTVKLSEAWTVVIPAAAAPTSGTSFTVEKADELTEPTEFATPLSRADLTLSSGQPQTPLTFTYRLAEPLPDGISLVLVGTEQSSGDNAPAATPVVPELSADRRVATATVPHLSAWEWWAIEANHFFTSAAGLRTDAPTCEAQPRPDWLDDAIFLDDKEAPLRVCIGKDPNDDSLAVVKIRNNRGVGMIVTAPVTPKWAYVTAWSGVPSEFVGDIASAIRGSMDIPESEQSRSWAIPPGGGVDIGFAEGSLPLTSKITAKVTANTVGYGLLRMMIEEQLDNPATVSAAEAVLMTACAADTGHGLITASDTTALAAEIAAFSVCVVEHSDDLLAEMSKYITDDQLKELRTQKKFTKFARFYLRALPAVTAAQYTVVLGDLAATTQLGEGAWEISLFKSIGPDTAMQQACGTIKDRRTVKHPKLGNVTVGLSYTGGGLSGNGCVVAVSSKGKTLLQQRLSVYGTALKFADPVTDATSNVFITYNPGRYNGVITLVPNDSGYEDIGWDGDTDYQTTKHAYYSAELQGPGTDGLYVIKTFANDCEPNCASGKITTTLLKWDGSAYSE